MPFITFEGVEAVGKSTQLGLLKERLESLGKPVITARLPGGTELGEKIRKIFKDEKDLPIVPQAELMLIAAAISQLVAERFWTALEKGTIVLADRFTDSTFAYQGSGRGISRDMIEAVMMVATGTIKPDKTIWLNLDKDESKVRREIRGEPNDRFDNENQDFYARVLNGYAQLALEEPERFIEVDGRGTTQEVHERIWAIVEPLT